jgi:hypothetical protein
MAQRTDRRGSSTVLTRRRLLTGGAVATGAAALTACGITDPDPNDAVAPGVVPAWRVERVPLDDPGSEEWKRAAEVDVELDAQLIALPNRPEPVVPRITVRAIHDGTTIGFRVEWGDDQEDDNTVRVDGFRDACAVLLAPGAGDEGLRVMGSAEQPATLLQWKADWELDRQDGIQLLHDSFPNAAVDTYPPLGASTGEITPVDYVEKGATEWLPGLHVGNPLSAETRSTSVEKLTARSFGNVTSAPTQNASGRGERRKGGWTVVLGKPLEAADPDEVSLVAAQSYTCAFAIWSGGDGDAGGRKSPSKTAYRLELRP